MDHCASGKTQGFFKVLIVREYYKSNKNVKDKLLRYESYRDKVSGFPVVKSSTDSRKYPISQAAILFIVLYCIYPLVSNLHKCPPPQHGHDAQPSEQLK